MQQRTITSSIKDMACIAHNMSDLLITVLEQENALPLLQEAYQDCCEMQPSAMSIGEFGDIASHLLVYSCFVARYYQSGFDAFQRQHITTMLSYAHPLHRQIVEAIMSMELQCAPLASWIDEVVAIVGALDRQGIDRGFQDDPLTHFYERFLHHYDAHLRTSHGIFYTSQPVISYIVRSIDYLLRSRFACRNGLADIDANIQVLDPACGTGVFVQAALEHMQAVYEQRGQAEEWQAHLSQHFLPRLSGIEVLITPYLIAHLRLNLFLAGLDVAGRGQAPPLPYTKDQIITGQGRGGACPAFPRSGSPSLPFRFANALSEPDIAQHSQSSIMVVLGNPPYVGHSINKEDWIRSLLDDYQEDWPELKKRAQAKWLCDDYVKFIRLGQWRIDRAGQGILAFITNHSYLDNPTFRGMRRSLMQSFDELFVLDLHGNSKKWERSPDETRDENIFAIQCGLAISIFVKHGDRDHSEQGGASAPVSQALYTDRGFAIDEGGGASAATSQAHRPPPLQNCDERSGGSCGEQDRHKAPSHPLSLQDAGPRASFSPTLPVECNEDGTTIYHAQIWGSRGEKLSWLEAHELGSTAWTMLHPRSPQYLLAPQETRYLEEYEAGWSVPDIFRPNGDPAPGIITCHDEFAVAWSREEMIGKVEGLLATREEDEARQRYYLCAQGQWNYAAAKRALSDRRWRGQLIQVLYRPFDTRWTVYNRHIAVHLRERVTRHMLHDESQSEQQNLALLIGKAGQVISGQSWDIVFCSRLATEFNLFRRGGNNIFPLYLTGDDSRSSSRVNLAPAFIAEVAARLELQWIAEGRGDLRQTIGPEDIFFYIYALLHAPTYRVRYAAFLKRDFPRIPLPSGLGFFRAVCHLGEELVRLHLLEGETGFITNYPVRGTDFVKRVRYIPHDEDETTGSVWINAGQYFENVPLMVWMIHIGGYQVCLKWLKDRRGRNLTADEVVQYQQMVAALAETVRLMHEIDGVIEEVGGWEAISTAPLSSSRSI